MSRKRMAWLVAVIIISVVIYTGWKFTARSAYESADYTVIDLDGAFELRQYPDLMVATTRAETGSQGRDGSFMRLFGFISGRNSRDEKIAMTVPVFMQAESDTAARSMAFVLPQSVVRKEIPQPNHNDVQITRRESGRFAVITFAGRANEKAVLEQEKRLRTWMKEKGLVGTSHIEIAGYDPPWTPGFFRRNELLIRLAK